MSFRSAKDGVFFIWLSRFRFFFGSVFGRGRIFFLMRWVGCSVQVSFFGRILFEV